MDVTEDQFRFQPTMDLFKIVVSDAARRNAYHPVRDYLDSLKWDGTARLDAWLITCGGAKDTPYVRAHRGT